MHSVHYAALIQLQPRSHQYSYANGPLPENIVWQYTSVKTYILSCIFYEFDFLSRMAFIEYQSSFTFAFIEYQLSDWADKVTTFTASLLYLHDIYKMVGEVIK